MIRYEVLPISVEQAPPIPMMVEVMICDRCGRRQVPVVHEAKFCAPGDEMDGVSLLSISDTYAALGWTRVVPGDGKNSFLDHCPGCQSER